MPTQLARRPQDAVLAPASMAVAAPDARTTADGGDARRTDLVVRESRLGWCPPRRNGQVGRTSRVGGRRALVRVIERTAATERACSQSESVNTVAALDSLLGGGAAPRTSHQSPQTLCGPIHRPGTDAVKVATAAIAVLLLVGAVGGTAPRRPALRGCVHCVHRRGAGGRQSWSRSRRAAFGRSATADNCCRPDATRHEMARNSAEPENRDRVRNGG